MRCYLHRLFSLGIALVMGWQLCAPLMQYAYCTDELELQEINWEEQESESDSSDKEELTEEAAKTASEYAYIYLMQQQLSDRFLVTTHCHELICSYKGSPQSPPPEV